MPLGSVLNVPLGQRSQKMSPAALPRFSVPAGQMHLNPSLLSLPFANEATKLLEQLHAWMLVEAGRLRARSGQDLHASAVLPPLRSGWYVSDVHATASPAVHQNPLRACAMGALRVSSWHMEVGRQAGRMRVPRLEAVPTHSGQSPSTSIVLVESTHGASVVAVVGVPRASLRMAPSAASLTAAS